MSASHSDQSTPAIQHYNHDGVVVPDIPASAKVSGPTDEAGKTNDARTGAEAIAPALKQRHSSHADSDRTATASPSSPPKLERFAYSFWDPKIAPFRKIVFKILGSGIMLAIIIMWLTLPMYWGSLWLSNVFTNNLGVRIVDYDGGAIGNAVTEGLMQRTGQLGYFVSSASDWPTTQGLIDSVLEEREWAAIVINQGATTNLQNARQNGNSAYNGSSAITVYYAQARNEQAANQYLVPYIQQALGQITGQYSSQSVAA